MLMNHQNIEMLLLIALFLGAYLVAYIGMWIQYRQMGMELDFSQPILDIMKRNDQLIRKALNVEKVFGICFFPVAIIGGMLFSKISNGGTLMLAFQDAEFLMRAIVLTIILVPIMWWGSSKMNHSAYGVLMEKLSNNIRRLEDLA